MKNRLLFLVLFVAGIFSGCKKSDFATRDLTIAEDEVFALHADEAADQVISSASFAGHMASDDAKGPGYRFFPFKNFPPCAAVTVTNATFPKEIVIDFDGNCSTWHGNSLTGKIIVTIFDRVITEGSVIKIVYENVKFGERAVNRESTLTNEGMNENGNWVISFASTVKVTHGNGHVSVREFSGEKEWISGFLTPEITDDKFYKTGSGTITVDDDVRFSRAITTPLYIDGACRFILSGVVEITRGGETMTINYGDGECDNTAVVSKDGKTEEIELGACRFKNESNKKNFRNLNGWW